MASADQKTLPDDASLADYLAGISPEPRRMEAARLAAIFTEVTGFAPKVWGGMLGFGRYDYHYASGHKGFSFAAGFAPRKAEIVIYGMSGHETMGAILADLGPHRLGKGCLYLKRLDGINENALRRLIRAGLDDLAQRWQVLPG